jgi:LmbE family N-acetylglucosaminyl deacetylase
LKRLYLPIARRLLYSRVSLFHAIAPAEANDIQALLPGARVVCIPHGPNPRLSQAMEPVPPTRERAPDEIRLVSVARLQVHQKGLDTLFDAFAAAKAALPDRRWSLTLIGPDHGGGRAELEARARHLGIEGQVHFAGEMNFAEVWRTLADSDLFVMLSRREALGSSVVEALVAGKPVVVSNEVGSACFPEIAAMPHVFRVPQGSREAAAAIVEAVKRLPELSAAAREHRETVRAFFSWNRSAEQLLACYAELLRSQQRSAVPASMAALHDKPARIDGETDEGGGPASAVLYVSPHADDVVFSCGGAVARDVASGRRTIVATVFSHAIRPGREEDDRSAIEGLGAEFVALGFADASLRGPRYRHLEGLLRPMREPERDMVDQVQRRLESILPSGSKLVLPLGVGGHIDHQICHEAGRRLAGRFRLWFYEDMPYSFCPFSVARRLAALGGHGECVRRGRIGELMAAAGYFVLPHWSRPMDVQRGVRIALAQQRHWRPNGPTRWIDERIEVAAFLDAKLKAIAHYRLEWQNNFASIEDWRRAYAAYARSIGSPTIIERRWRPSEPTIGSFTTAKRPQALASSESDNARAPEPARGDQPPLSSLRR